MEEVTYVCKCIQKSVRQMWGENIPEDISDEGTTELQIVDFDMLSSFLKTKDCSQLVLHYLSNKTIKLYNNQSQKMIKATKKLLQKDNIKTN